MPRTKDQASRNVGGNANKDSNGDKQNRTPNRKDAYMGAMNKTEKKTRSSMPTTAPKSAPRSSMPTTAPKASPRTVPNPKAPAPASSTRAMRDPRKKQMQKQKQKNYPGYTRLNYPA
jgi:hypothetical protein